MNKRTAKYFHTRKSIKIVVKRAAPKPEEPKMAVWFARDVLLAIWHGSHECKVVTALNISNLAPTIF
jgi:hypothetical protein